jgi:hypothetical protein
MKTKQFGLISILLAALCFTGCQTVDVTKTAKGFHTSTNPNDIEIFMTRPDRSYEELGTVFARGFAPSDTAVMHNAIRAKAAPLGANAVVVTGNGLDANNRQYAIGVAIAWK